MIPILMIFTTFGCDFPSTLAFFNEIPPGAQFADGKEDNLNPRSIGQRLFGRCVNSIGPSMVPTVVQLSVDKPACCGKHARQGALSTWKAPTWKQWKVLSVS